LTTTFFALNSIHCCKNYQAYFFGPTCNLFHAVTARLGVVGFYRVMH